MSFSVAPVAMSYKSGQAAEVLAVAVVGMSSLVSTSWIADAAIGIFARRVALQMHSNSQGANFGQLSNACHTTFLTVFSMET